MAYEPSDVEVREFYAQMPPRYAQCRARRHGAEVPYTVARPDGPKGKTEVTTVCACGRLVTRVYYPTRSGGLVRAVDETRVRYPREPRYLALPGMGGVDMAVVNARAVEADIAALAGPANGAPNGRRKPKAK